MNKNDYIHLLKEACGDRCNAEYNPCIFRQAADSLAALKPVAWLWKDGTVTTDPDRADGTWAKLYALDELKAELAKPEPSKLCKCIDEFWCATFDRCKRNE